MPRWLIRFGAVAAAIVLSGWSASRAMAAWRLTGRTYASIAYNQGVAFDQSQGLFFLDGVVSATNSGLYRTNAGLSLQAARFSVIPPTVEGYNHSGDLSFDPGTPLRAGTLQGAGRSHRGSRLLLPLECYYPARGGNTCGTGAIGVADPQSLRFLYYVTLDRAQIQKAMWDELSPDGNWIWTSSGKRLLVYRNADVNAQTAARQRAGLAGGIVGRDLGPVLPSANVTGAAFDIDPATGAPRLWLSLNLGTSFEVVSYDTGVAAGSPTILSPTATVEITVKKSFNDNEPEGLTMTAAVRGSLALGGTLHWQMLPVIPFNSSILNYLPG